MKKILIAVILLFSAGCEDVITVSNPDERQAIVASTQTPEPVPAAPTPTPTPTPIPTPTPVPVPTVTETVTETIEVEEPADDDQYREIAEFLWVRGEAINVLSNTINLSEQATVAGIEDPAEYRLLADIIDTNANLLDDEGLWPDTWTSEENSMGADDGVDVALVRTAWSYAEELRRTADALEYEDPSAFDHLISNEYYWRLIRLMGDDILAEESVTFEGEAP